MTYQKVLFLISLVALIVVLAWVTSTSAVTLMKGTLTISPNQPTPIPLTPTPSEDVLSSPSSSEYGNFWVPDPDQNVNLSESGGRGSEGIKGRGTSNDEGKKLSEEEKRELPQIPELRNP